MKRAIALILLLAACKEEAAQLPDPVPLTADALGHYCQMNLLEHPGPKAQVHLEGLPGAPLFFSQVRDAVAYARMPEQSHAIVGIYVNDMGAAPSWEDTGAGNWIAAGEAHYVVGSRRIGGMGAPEMVPFADPDKAAAFAAEHGGKVMRLSAIPDAEVLTPVNLESDAVAPGDGDFEERLRALTRETGG
ncbi:nitrous oxide reductase accessory protein NosL [Ostreiculturibacter nitratireducens]|uniref:nitrous oxide reductase accessory protein NosL n=1 Tax=Ostreiculturibacter nitratireducens TaxID=3075226 RepID=UPI0031B57B0E